MAATIEEKQLYVQIWQKTVDTQMHFNEMSVKSRQLGLTFVAGALGVGVVLLSRGSDFAVSFVICGWTIQIHVSALIVFAAALALWAVRILDLNVYHKMLRGAVTFGEDFEEVYMKEIFSLNKGMTQAISHYSRCENASVTTVNGQYLYNEETPEKAENKIKAFYNVAVFVLIAVAFGLLIVTNLTSG